METGFIGLGNLGNIMVKNLVETGRKIHIYNRTKEKTKPYEESTSVHTDVASIGTGCDIIFSILSDDAAVESLCFNQGLIENMKPGSVHVCLSTIAPSTSSRLYNAHKDKNIDYLTATIIGRPEAAQAKALTVCLSGASSQKELVVEILRDLGGKNIKQFGDDPKSAAVVKICTNFLITSAIEAMGEAFNLVAKAGADPASFHEMITENLFSAPIYKNYGKTIIDETYDKAGFTSQLGFKDTRLALALANEAGVTLPFADVIKNRFIINHNRGRNQWDWASIAHVIKEENGSL
jgi:3-hydroxyisobutyrate dehydrogenase-like beta-hydroxyacid dehydrogenase